MNLPSHPVELLAQMVATNSVNSHLSGRPQAEAELAIWLENVAHAWQLETVRLPVDGGAWNLLVHPPPRNGLPWLLLESHMDTVGIEGMSIPPLKPELRDGKMFGRGACDTKASGAAMLWSLKEEAKSGRLANNSALLFTVDEEVGKSGIKAFVSKQSAALGWRPSLAIVGEPTRFAPVIAHNGAVRWKIATSGISAHSSNPANGHSAISDMVEIIREIEAAYIPSLAATHPLTGKAQCSINQIHGGTQANMIAARCEIVLDRRLVPGEKAESVLPEVEAVLLRLQREGRVREFEQGDVFYDEPMTPLHSEEILAWIAPALREQGLAVAPAGMPYGTDASNLTNAGIPSIVLGPGDIRQAHTTDEFVEIGQISLAVTIYSALLRQQLPIEAAPILPRL